jgi:DNA (cytosine-5)-methyltransferase 1
VRYLSVCSGIEAATVAWHPLGWSPAAFSEIEAFPRAVLAHHYPTVPCHGDFTTIGADEYGAIDLLVGGTPCQSFSVAGLRGGLGDDRGNLALEYLRLADRARPRWLVWENVPGVLSSNGGRDFGAILGGMVELGYSFSYRVLDAQFFGVPQRRRRVFVVGHLGDWRRAAAVLFERHSLQGHPAGPDGSPAYGFNWQNGGGYGDANPGLGITEEGCGPLQRNNTPAVAYALQGAGRTSQGSQGSGWKEDCSFTLNCMDEHGVAYGAAVRKFTPRECERLQGFPDDYTAVPYRGKPAADGPRYKALGNSMAVPVMRWIGERIAMVEALSEQRSEAA